MNNLANQENEIDGVAYELVDENLRAGREVRLEIHTESMLPTLRPGNGVIVRGAEVNDLRMGDLVVVKVGARLLAHRLIHLQNVAGDLQLTTKGDNLLEPDRVWSASQICGIIIAVDRNGRRRSLTSDRARRYGALLAGLSRLQWGLWLARQGLLQRIALKGSRILWRISGSLAP